MGTPLIYLKSVPSKIKSESLIVREKNLLKLRFA